MSGDFMIFGLGMSTVNSFLLAWRETSNHYGCDYTDKLMMIDTENLTNNNNQLVPKSTLHTKPLYLVDSVFIETSQNKYVGY